MDISGSVPEVMRLLSSGIPLSLLADISDPSGPRSEEILVSEGAPTDKWWQR